jgi:hypothetical protein
MLELMAGAGMLDSVQVFSGRGTQNQPPSQWAHGQPKPQGADCAGVCVGGQNHPSRHSLQVYPDPEQGPSSPEELPPVGAGLASPLSHSLPD